MAQRAEQTANSSKCAFLTSLHIKINLNLWQQQAMVRGGRRKRLAIANFLEPNVYGEQPAHTRLVKDAIF